jgi:hypothetical protein
MALVMACAASGLAWEEMPSAVPELSTGEMIGSPAGPAANP